MDLSGLKDIHLPVHDVSVFPLAIGWWLLISLPFVVFLFFGIVRMFIYIKKQSVRFQAFKELNAVVKSDKKFYEKSVKISLLLKRIAIGKFGNNKIAKLHGKTWEKFLKEHSGFKDFETIKLISSISYRKPESISSVQFVKLEKLAKEFIRKVL